jgi:hypothetical protein
MDQGGRVNYPPLEEIVPFLTERGRVEVDLALANCQRAQMQQQIEALSEEVVSLKADQIEADQNDEAG